MLVDAERQLVHVVTAFEQRDQPPATVPVGGFEHPRAHPSEELRAQTDVRQRVVDVRIEAGRDNDELGCECVYARENLLDEDLSILLVSGARRHRAVEGRAFTASDAGLRKCASARIERILMSAHVEHGRVFLERVLRAVAVVHVPIEDQNLVETMLLLQITRCNSDIVEQAESECLIVLRVMARRTGKRESVLHVTRDDLVGDLLGAPDCEQGNVVGFSRDTDVHDIQKWKLLPAGITCPCNECAAVHAFYPDFIGDPRRESDHLLEPVLQLQVRHGARQAFTALGMSCAGIVIETALVVENTGCHSGVTP